MATGIVAIGARAEGLPWLAVALGLLAAAAWAVLTVLAMTERLMPFGFVAATGVLASESMLSGVPFLRGALWALAGLAWIRLTWRELRALGGVRVRELIPFARGSWLLPAVATQSLAIVTAQHSGSSPLPFAAGLGLCCGGLAAYVVAAGLLAARVAAHRVRLLDVTPDWWIVMGALAISTLAAISLWNAPGAAVDGPLRVGSVALWVAASAAIPALLAADAIRTGRLGVRYEPERWSMVFPLGMYAVATHALGVRLELGALTRVSTISFGCALAAWAVTAVGLVSTRPARTPGRAGAGARRCPRPAVRRLRAPLHSRARR